MALPARLAKAGGGLSQIEEMMMAIERNRMAGEQTTK